jgi:hypothetical protein
VTPLPENACVDWLVEEYAPSPGLTLFAVRRRSLQMLYSDFLVLVKSRAIENAAVDESGDKVYFTLRAKKPSTSADTSTSSTDSFSPSTGERPLPVVIACPVSPHVYSCRDHRERYIFNFFRI